MPYDLPDKHTRTRSVSLEFLEELYDRAGELADLRRWLRAAHERTPEEIAGYLERLDKRLPLA